MFKTCGEPLDRKINDVKQNVLDTFNNVLKIKTVCRKNIISFKL